MLNPCGLAAAVANLFQCNAMRKSLTHDLQKLQDAASAQLRSKETAIDPNTTLLLGKLGADQSKSSK